MLYIVTLVLAFCSIVYELLLGQTLSAFLGNTIVRYSVTIGLYMCSMGLGAMFLPRKLEQHCISGLLKVELMLSIIGASSVILLLSLHSFGLEGLAFAVLAHTLIVVIGILTGFEIPLLVATGNILRKDSEARVLGVDYIGAFLGTVLFAFVFYPSFGIFATAFFTGLMNSLVGISLITYRGYIDKKQFPRFRVLLGAQAVVALVLSLLLWHLETVERIGMEMFLRRS